jgi:hypothetical protein
MQDTGYRKQDKEDKELNAEITNPKSSIQNPKLEYPTSNRERPFDLAESKRNVHFDFAQYKCSGTGERRRGKIKNAEY